MLSLKCAYAYDSGDGDGLVVHCIVPLFSSWNDNNDNDDDSDDDNDGLVVHCAPV